MFLVAHKKCFCLDGLGTGKTLSAIWAMDFLMERGIVRRTLIVAPTTICEYVWGRELFTTLSRRRYKLLTGVRKAKQEAARDTRNKILIVNPESLHIVANDLPEVDLIIVDEFTKFKNHRCRRYKALKAISANRRLWLLSATPAPQSPLDAYGPIRLVREEKLGFLWWRDLTMSQASRFTWIARPDAERKIAEYMQPAIRHKREDCFDMPDISVIPLEAPLTPEQTAAIKQFQQEALAEFQEAGVITTANAAGVLSKCLQVMGGNVYWSKQGEKHIQAVNAEPFFEAIETVVEQANTPVLVFVPFRSVAESIHTKIRSAGYESRLITGDTSKEDRAKYFDDIQHGRAKALVAVSSTVAHGITLTAARYVLWALPPYSYEEYEQANGRVVRPQQKNAVVIYHLIQNTLARSLFRRLKTKEKLQNAVLELLEEGRKHYVSRPREVGAKILGPPQEERGNRAAV